MVWFGTLQMVWVWHVADGLVWHEADVLVWFGTRQMIWFSTWQTVWLSTRQMVWFGTRQMVWFGYLLGRSLLADIRPSSRLLAVVILELPVLVRHARVPTVTEIFTVACKKIMQLYACHAQVAFRAKKSPNNRKVTQPPINFYNALMMN
jgi:hypothetical protein